jgi:hypothetical protein
MQKELSAYYPNPTPPPPPSLRAFVIGRCWVPAGLYLRCADVSPASTRAAGGGDLTGNVCPCPTHPIPHPTTPALTELLSMQMCLVLAGLYLRCADVLTSISSGSRGDASPRVLLIQTPCFMSPLLHHSTAQHCSHPPSHPLNLQAAMWLSPLHSETCSYLNW